MSMSTLQPHRPRWVPAALASADATLVVLALVLLLTSVVSALVPGGDQVTVGATVGFLVVLVATSIRYSRY